jgi:polar amino acid transport system substrate-binding protein
MTPACGKIRQMSEEARRELAPHGPLRAGINERNPVLVSTRAPDGGPDGVAPALAAELAARLAVPLDLVPYPSPGPLADRAGADEWDIALLGAEPARAATMNFTAPYAELPVSYLVHTGSGIRLADADQPGRTIVATRGSAYTLWLEAHLAHATLEQVGTPAQARELFAAHPGYLFVGLTSALAAEAERLPGTTVLPGQFMAVQQAIACPPGRPAGLAFLQAFVAQAVTSGLVAELISRFGVGGALSVPDPSLRADHGQAERLVAGRVGHRLVHLIQRELGDLVLPQVEQAGPGQADQVRRRRPREHPLTSHGDAVAHQPPVRQHEVVAHAAHQHHPAELPHGHGRGLDRRRAGGGRQQVQHHVDRAVGR